jgi:hypothetical protein
VLPSRGVPLGEIYEVNKYGVNALSTYPGTGETIGTLGDNSATRLAARQAAISRRLLTPSSSEIP